MKKRFGVVALAAAAGCAVIFAGCTGCNGCGANGKANEAAFSSNWYADTNFRLIQPTFTEGNGNFASEEITYTVKHDKATAGNTTYSVEYEDGTYTTVFYAKTFNKDLIAEDFRGDYNDNLTVYYYRTELTFPSVTFKIANNEDAVQKFENERTVTESYFLSVNDHLRPLYSQMQTDTHIPAVYQTNEIDSAYKHVKQTVTTSYNYNGTAAKTVIVDELDSANNKEQTRNGLNDTDNSLIDVCGLNIAVRAMQLSASLNQTISVYSPAGGMQNYTFAGSATALGDDERKAFEDVLAGKSLYVKGDDKTLNTVCVAATLNGEMQGVSQKYWFTAIDNAKNNKGRATMVKMSVPITFSLGTLNYSLKEVNSTPY